MARPESGTLFSAPLKRYPVVHPYEMQVQKERRFIAYHRETRVPAIINVVCIIKKEGY
jgi:hypothetical protein